MGLSPTTYIKLRLADPIKNNGEFAVIYGHDKKWIFGIAKDQDKNDILTIFTGSGPKVYYAYDYDVQVTPEQASIITEGRAENYVALMTRDGLFYTKRRLLYLRRVGYEL